jgi:long-chain acyl-CoA synthetase
MPTRIPPATVVRGQDAPIEELRYIYDNSDSSEVVVLQGPSLLKKLAEAAGKVSF